VSALHPISSYIKHKLFEINAHSLHSPSLYQLYQECFDDARQQAGDPVIEGLRAAFRKDERTLSVDDLGAGSRISGNPVRTVRSIARGGITRHKYSRLFQHLIRYFDHRTIVELGTALGINTLYLAASDPEVKVWTFEAWHAVSEIARKAFNEAGYHNITILHGNIDATLPEFLGKGTLVDFAFIDANHTYAATMAYFEQLQKNLSARAVVVIDDINWSWEMTRAWHEITSMAEKATCIDIYQCGILLFDDKIQPGKLRFEY